MSTVDVVRTIKQVHPYDVIWEKIKSMGFMNIYLMI